MTWPTIWVGLLCFCAILLSTTPPTVHYEPEVVRLKGILRESICPGPPEYASIEMGDTPERIFVLHLDTPINVLNIDPKEDSWNEPESNISAIQVAASPHDVQHLINAPVVMTGSLFHAITAHHRTEVIMINDRIDVIE